jgi:hypothetical protein
MKQRMPFGIYDLEREMSEQKCVYRARILTEHLKTRRKQLLWEGWFARDSTRKISFSRSSPVPQRVFIVGASAF